MNRYPVNPENAIEMARLLNQHARLAQAMGGLLVELRAKQIEQFHDALDLACGPGGWVLDIARTFPSMQATGIDISTIMIDYGRAAAQMRTLSNARFLTMNLDAPLLFPDASFDLVNGRFLTSILRLNDWPPLLLEAMRVCRPGSIIRLTEYEVPATNSSACQQLHQLYVQAYQLTGRSPNTDGKTLGFNSMLTPLLNNTGFLNVQQHVYTLDLSINSPLHSGFYQNILSFFQVLQPFITGLQLISERDYQRLYQQMLREVIMPRFHATFDLFTAWGEKP